MPLGVGIFVLKKFLYASHINKPENFGLDRYRSSVLFTCKPYKAVIPETKCHK